MRVTGTLAAVALALSACGKAPVVGAEHNVTVVVPGQNGATAVVGNQVPQNLPAFVKIYPGARVAASTSTPKGGMLVLEVNAPSEAVMDFYRKAAADAGMASSVDSWTIGGAPHTGPHMVMFGMHSGSAGGKTLTATVEGKGGATKVELLYGVS